MVVKSDIQQDPKPSADGRDYGCSEWFVFHEPAIFNSVVRQFEAKGWVIEYDKARCWYWFKPPGVAKGK